MKEHPAVFPVELPLALMSFLTAEGELVLDPFGGAGSTMIAAEKSGRRCGIIDIDPVYCDIAVERWRRLTSGTPKRIPAEEARA